MGPAQTVWNDIGGTADDPSLATRADILLSNLAAPATARQNLGLGGLATASGGQITPGVAQRWNPTVAGVNQTIPFTPAAGAKLDIYVNGAPQVLGVDYTVSGTALTFLGAGVTPADVLTAATSTLSFS